MRVTKTAFTKISFASLIECPGSAVVYCFVRGPTMREIGKFAIDGRLVSLVVTRMHANRKTRKVAKNFIVDMRITNLAPDCTSTPARYLFEAEIVSHWPFAYPGPGNMLVHGTLDWKRKGVFFFRDACQKTML